MILAIGTDGVDYDSEVFSCVVNNPSTDIIKVSSVVGLNSIEGVISNFLCAEHYGFKITEVQPVGSDAFVELFNYGRPVETGALIEIAGSVTGSPLLLPVTTAPIPTNSFFTVHNNGASCNGVCQNAGVDVLGSNGATKRAFDYTVTINSSSSQLQWLDDGKRLVVEDGYTYQIYSKGFGTQRIYNWRQSCSQGVGNMNLDTVATCSYSSCTPARCGVSGATSTSCEMGAPLCICGNCGGGQCQSDYFALGTNCPPLGMTTNCKALVVPDPGRPQNADAFKFIWDPVDTEASALIIYQLEGTRSNDVVEFFCADIKLPYCAVEKSSVKQAPGTGDITANAQTLSKGSTDYHNVGAECQVVTLSPSTKPTANPSMPPVLKPTSNPTPSPTFGEPKYLIGNSDLYLNGYQCSGSRCLCSTGSHGCVGNLTSIPVVTTRAGTAIPLTITNIAGGDWDATICYEINEMGILNKSCITDGTCEAQNGRRRLLSRDRRRRRRRLQGNITTASDLKVSLGRTGGCIHSNQTNFVYSILASDEQLSCEQGSTVCFDNCEELRAWFEFNLTNCTVNYYGNPQPCDFIYPSLTNIYVKRGDCNTYFKGEGDDDSIPLWIWWILIAVVIFLIILAILVYRFWWKGKAQTSELADAEDELQQQNKDNDDGFGADLDTGDVVFNPMATGVPGMNRPVDAFGNEIEQRQQDAKHEVADVQVEKFQEREAYGQVQQQAKQ